MSASCLSRCRAAEAAGFTLLEILVVLTIIGLTAAVGVPRLAAVYDSVAFALSRETVEQNLSALPYQAYARGGEIVLQAVARGGSPAGAVPALAAPAQVGLPEGWRIETDRPILYRSSGFCSGGVVTVHAGSVSERYVLRSPRCLAERAP